MLTALLLSSVVLLATADADAGPDLEIADLSPTLRLDLVASPTNVFPGQSIELTATLTNTGNDTVSVLPAHMLARIKQVVDPRCENQTATPSYGHSIAEAGVTPTERDFTVLRPGKRIRHKRSIPAPEVPGCAAGGTFVVSATYCMFYDMIVDGVTSLTGCVGSNTVAVLVDVAGASR